jgi:AcrR family transcriptional regulator
MRPTDPAKETAIQDAALSIIASEGLENLSMQRLAQAAGVSPRTIYIKYENKEDLIIRLFIETTLPRYEAAVLQGFDETLDFEAGVRLLWMNAFRFLRAHEAEYRLLMYSKSSPLLVAAFSRARIEQGQHFQPIAAFLGQHARRGVIRKVRYEVARALLFAPLLDLVQEYFEHLDRPRQLVTEALIRSTATAAAASLLLHRK